MPRFAMLSDWLAWLETLHPQAIDLGLARVYQVANQLQLLITPENSLYQYSGTLAITGVQVFSVAGTNGKGSCVKTIEQCLLAQQHTVGSYTSPHLHHYCERIQINGKPVAESWLCAAFAAIDQARGDISLTYFEFSTLAALWIFKQQKIPFVILEVGLGGRLDAVNIVDADIAIITSIAVDHEAWLGNNRDTIAIEKLGITRASKPVVIAENQLTHSLQQFISEHPLVSTINHDFTVSLNSGDWIWSPSHLVDAPVFSQLPIPALPLNSVAAGLQALYICHVLPNQHELKHVLRTLQLPGRFQISHIQAREVIFDVAHNPAATTVLAEQLRATTTPTRKTIGVFAVMDDKNIHAMIASLCSRQPASIDYWYIGDLLHNERSADSSSVCRILQSQQQPVTVLPSIEAAFEEALKQSAERDRIVVFGSFFTVAAIQKIVYRKK